LETRNWFKLLGDLHSTKAFSRFFLDIQDLADVKRKRSAFGTTVAHDLPYTIMRMLQMSKHYQTL